MNAWVYDMLWFFSWNILRISIFFFYVTYSNACLYASEVRSLCCHWKDLQKKPSFSRPFFLQIGFFSPKMCYNNNTNFVWNIFLLSCVGQWDLSQERARSFHSPMWPCLVGPGPYCPIPIWPSHGAIGLRCGKALNQCRLYLWSYILVVYHWNVFRKRGLF